jgi:hypothetical protein
MQRWSTYLTTLARTCCDLTRAQRVTGPTGASGILFSPLCINRDGDSSIWRLGKMVRQLNALRSQAIAIVRTRSAKLIGAALSRLGPSEFSGVR